MSLTVKAYAKINLWLDITGYRGDGYHTINTVMRRIDLYDDVEIETCSGSDVTVRCVGNDVLEGLNPTAENLAYWICQQIDTCYKVTVQESEGNTATYEED